MRDMRLVPIILFSLSFAGFAQQPSDKNTEPQPSGANTEQSFASAGKVEMHLRGGDYEIVGTDASTIRVTSTGPNADQVKVSVAIQNSSARISGIPNHSDNLHVHI